MGNDLPQGVRRTGDFYDSYPDTPETKVALERSAKGISVTVAWSHPDAPYAGWFLDSSFSGRVVQHSEPRPVPSRVLFHDSHGAVLLIGCRARGYHANLLGPGSGTLWARAAIFDVQRDCEFDQPHGLRTEISGLREWLGVTSWRREEDWSERPLRLSLTTAPAPAIELGTYQGFDVRLVPSWGLRPDESRDERVLLDLLRCETRSDSPRDWDAHVQIHRAIRDLLVLSRWHDESCVEVYAMRLDDPRTTLDGSVHGEQWREVQVPDDERRGAPTYRSHLVHFDELEVAGIRKWLDLRDEFARALDPVITTIDLRNATAHTRLAHAGPGLEALGYLLMLRDGVTERAAAFSSLHSRLKRILEDVAHCLPFDGASWATQTVEVYNGLKHANRKLPDSIDVLNVWRQAVLTTRAWVARELGVEGQALKERLELDPQRHPYVKSH